MDAEDLKNRLDAIESNAKSQRGKAIHEYCMANNTVKIGDIISNRQACILVESIKASKLFGSDRYECAYAGIDLTKKLEPKKNGSKSLIFQSSIEKHIAKPNS